MTHIIWVILYDKNSNNTYMWMRIQMQIERKIVIIKIHPVPIITIASGDINWPCLSMLFSSEDMEIQMIERFYTLFTLRNAQQNEILPWESAQSVMTFQITFWKFPYWYLSNKEYLRVRQEAIDWKKYLTRSRTILFHIPINNPIT